VCVPGRKGRGPATLRRVSTRPLLVSTTCASAERGILGGVAVVGCLMASGVFKSGSSGKQDAHSLHCARTIIYPLCPRLLLFPNHQPGRAPSTRANSYAMMPYRVSKYSQPPYLSLFFFVVASRR